MIIVIFFVAGGDGDDDAVQLILEHFYKLTVCSSFFRHKESSRAP